MLVDLYILCTHSVPNECVLLKKAKTNAKVSAKDTATYLGTFVFGEAVCNFSVWLWMECTGKSQQSP